MNKRKLSKKSQLDTHNLIITFFRVRFRFRVRPTQLWLHATLLLFRPQTNIYFYTIKPILPNQELLVWYCKEFATRLNYPLTGEQMLLKIRKC